MNGKVVIGLVDERILSYGNISYEGHKFGLNDRYTKDRGHGAVYSTLSPETAVEDARHLLALAVIKADREPVECVEDAEINGAYTESLTRLFTSLDSPEGRVKVGEYLIHRGTDLMKGGDTSINIVDFKQGVALVGLGSSLMVARDR